MKEMAMKWTFTALTKMMIGMMMTIGSTSMTGMTTKKMMIKVKINKNKITKRKTRMILVVCVGEGFKATPIHLIRFITERIVK